MEQPEGKPGPEIDPGKLPDVGAWLTSVSPIVLVILSIACLVLTVVLLIPKPEAAGIFAIAAVLGIGLIRRDSKRP